MKNKRNSVAERKKERKTRKGKQSWKKLMKRKFKEKEIKFLPMKNRI